MADPSPSGPRSDTIDQLALRRNALQLIYLRGMAFYVQILAILTAHFGLHLVIRFEAMLGVSALLVGFNLVCLWRYRSRQPISALELLLGLGVDVLALTALLALSGGSANPFISLFLVPVILGAVLLRPVHAWALYGLTLVCYGGLTLMRQDHVMSHGPSHDGIFDLHVHGMMIAYALSGALIVGFVSRIRANLDQRNQELAALQQQAAEEAQILRMGLLSAGAAHELSTPLTTVGVTLQDWIDLPLDPDPVRAAAEVRADAERMMIQIARCKTIVSDILAASGDVRGEGGAVQSLRAAVQDTVRVWADLHPDIQLDVQIRLPETPVLFDRILQQAVFNGLDNAAEASRSVDQADVRIMADLFTPAGRTDENWLRISLSDQGPGFDPAIAARIGQPYATTKAPGAAGQGRGLGLFLVTNLLRKLGGQLEIMPPAPASEQGLWRGAHLILSFPLSAISVSASE
ncbi:MAG: ATP-binding protein [Asticcacaulis sp.]